MIKQKPWEDLKRKQRNTKNHGKDRNKNKQKIKGSGI